MSKLPVAAGKSSFDLINKEQFFSFLDLQGGEIYLDLACGMGRYSFPLAERVGETGILYAIDLWAEGIAALAEEINKKQIPNVTTMVADLCETIPLPSSSADGCLMATALHDLPLSGQKNVIAEMHRILKPGGVFSVIEFNKVEKGPGPPLHIKMSEEEVVTLFSDSGFSKIDSKDIGPHHYMVRCKRI
jgi:ubiquinone/menaquinone biosynthesis C-methylase UbiE